MADLSLSRGRARLGVLVPFTNTNLEPDLALMKPEGISLHFARIGGYDENEVPDEQQMQGLGATKLDDPLQLLVGSKPDLVMYGCTSATLTHGPEFDRALAAKIQKLSDAHTVTAAGALVNALEFLDAKSIGFCSPYVPVINDMAIDFLATFGVRTVNRSEVEDRLSNAGQGELTPQAVFELALTADHEDAEVVVLSCTDMRSIETIAKLEQAIGKPVIASNQAMMFQALQMLGINDSIPGFGTLLKRERR